MDIHDTQSKSSGDSQFCCSCHLETPQYRHWKYDHGEVEDEIPRGRSELDFEDISTGPVNGLVPIQADRSANKNGGEY